MIYFFSEKRKYVMPHLWNFCELEGLSCGFDSVSSLKGHHKPEIQHIMQAVQYIESETYNGHNDSDP